MATGRGAVIAALIGNSFLTIIKFGAFLLSGSGAMLSEAIHSFADSGNQALLYAGIRRSERQPDAMFHYGYGAERFLFALLSAVGIFVLGCGVTIYHGIHTLIHPPDLSVSWITFAVLGIAFLVDGYVLISAVRAVNTAKGQKSFLQHIRTSSDPTVLAVLFEDGIATLGVLVAAAGIGLAHVTGDARFDAISSILIGLMLGAVAIWLGWRNRELILGPAMPPHIERAAVEFLEAQPSINGVRDIKSRILAADTFRLKAEVDYNGRYLVQEHLDWAREQLGRADVEPHRFAEELGERVLDSLAHEIDRLEVALQQKFPRIRHVDFESDDFGSDLPEAD